MVEGNGRELFRGAYDRRAFLRSAGLLGAGTAALLVVGCGGDDDGATPTAAATTPGSTATAVPNTATPTPAPATVKLISWSTPRTEQANIFAAEELGYLADENLQYEYIPGRGSGDSLRQLLAGNGDIAFAGPEGIFLAIEEGADIVGVYNTYPQNLFTLVAKPSTGITTVADMAGKSIGVLSLASGGRYNTITVLESNGLKEEDVTLVATGPAPTAFLEDQVDVWMTLTTTEVSLRAEGIEMNSFPVSDYANLPTDVFAMNRSDFDDEEKRAVALRFLRAIKRGTEFMIDDPQAAAEISINHGLDITELEPAITRIEAFGVASQSAGTTANGLGWFDMDVLQEGADLYFASGVITKGINVADYFTNDLVTQL